MSELCSTCLSKDRRLLPLKCLEHVVTSIGWADLKDNMDGSLCWECCAVFQKTYKFRRQVLQAQRTLRLLQEMDKPTDDMKSYSNLSSFTKTSYDETICFNNSIKQEIDEGILKYDMKLEDQEEVEKYEDVQIKIEKYDEEKLFEVDLLDQVKPIIPEEAYKEDVERKGNGSTNLNVTENCKMNLSTDEKKFIVKKMSLQDFYETRDIDGNGKRYKRSPYKCIKCITGYFNEDKYNSHMKNKHHNAPFKCLICETAFNKKFNLECHYDRHFRSYQCRQCEFKHHRLKTMLIHMTKQHSTDKFGCNICKEKFSKPSALKYHMDKFHRERLKCEICEKTFIAAQTLKLHMKFHTNSVQLQQCPQCGGKYRNLACHLRSHDRSLANEDAYCAECGVQFKNSHIYRQHLIQHTRHRQGTLKYGCTHCSSTFADKTNLSRHIAYKHTKEYPFSCDLCAKGFVRKDRLRAHNLEKHEGVARPKDKVCGFCEKAFKDKKGLMIHIRTHTGEKPYQCEYCQRKFAQKSTLTTHVRGVHLKLKGI